MTFGSIFKIPSQSEWWDFTNRGRDAGLIASAAAVALIFLSPPLANETVKNISLAFIFLGGVLRYWNGKKYPEVSPRAMIQLSAILMVNAIAWATFLWPFVTAPDTTSSHYQIFGFVIMSAVLASIAQIFVSQSVIFYAYSLILTMPAIVSAIEDLRSGRSPYLAFYLSFFFLFLAKQRRVFIEQWRALEKSKQDLDGMINNFPGAISLVRNGKYIYANTEVAKITGLSLNKIIDYPVGHNQPDAPIPKLLLEMEAAHINNIQNREVALPSPQGPQEHLVFLNRLQNDDIVVVSLNISSQRSLERELVQQKAKAQNAAKMAALGEMSGGLSHEINNPLAIIMGNNHRIKQLLIRTPVDAEAIIKLSDSNTKVVDRIAKIVTGLKNFARDGNRDPFAPANLGDILIDTLTFCETRFESHRISIKKIGFEKRIFVECRNVQVGQVLLNLLNNAYDALEGASQKWIEIELSDLGECARIVIRDSGKGVPQAVRDKLMQPFFTTKEIGKGTGLGLSISKGLIEDHHGKLFFDYEHPHTTVVLEIPKKQPVTASKNAA